MSLQSFQADRPGIAVVGYDAANLSQLEQVVGPLGRIVSSSLLFTAVPEQMRSAPFVVLDAAEVHGTTEADAVERIGWAISTTSQFIVRASLENMDLIDALCPRARLVIGSEPADLHLALASSVAALPSVGGAVSDVTVDEGMRLQRLADEIARIARTLVDLPEGLAKSRPNADEAGDTGALVLKDTDVAGANVTAAEVRAIIRLRRMRDRFFPAELFADPAWDMLLDLAAARIERVRVAVSSLCIAAAVPPTTALRWIKAMTDKGLLRRVADPHDARRIFIQLSDDAAAAMEKFLRAARDSGGRAI
ncbi:MAG TPA: MarR family transcriptional regulator [Sphingomonas sp.]|nr:MarR family transcriptional regulator [Sphingomonas sp.]